MLDLFKPAGLAFLTANSRHDLFTIREDAKNWSLEASLATHAYFLDDGRTKYVKVVLTGRKATTAPNGALGIKAKVYRIVNDRNGDRLGSKETAWIV